MAGKASKMNERLNFKSVEELLWTSKSVKSAVLKAIRSRW